MYQVKLTMRQKFGGRDQDVFCISFSSKDEANSLFELINESTTMTKGINAFFDGWFELTLNQEVKDYAQLKRVVK